MQQIRNANNTTGADVTNYLYVTANQVQSIAQASVKYLIGLTSMSSKNSLYFLPLSVGGVNTDNIPRYIRLGFAVMDKDQVVNPAAGVIKFYDSTGGLDTYPMGFYTYRIYEQTSTTNLDPANATLIETGMAYVRDYSGNMEEVTPDFNEYNPTVNQYVYP
jgi:hypothetical protein|tara:strand:- start:110 stop:592 length:483 start_codon:yes stop_codon:yes gene_type:complete